MTTDHLEFVQEIGTALEDLGRRACAIYRDEVDSLIREGCRDENRIEWTLDHLLDFCYDAEALVIYKRLCRYYFRLNPAGTVLYIQAYREMWDTEPEVVAGPFPEEPE